MQSIFKSWRHWPLAGTVGVFGILLCWATMALSQQPPAPPPPEQQAPPPSRMEQPQLPPPAEQIPCGAPSRLPAVPVLIPRPAEGFIESLKGNDAVINVIVRQGRLLTLTGNIVGTQRPAVVAVGDPKILDFEILPNPRTIRLIGRRPGVTDLSVVTAEGQAFSFEVHVLFDLDLLRAHLRQTFPGTEIRLSQLRNEVVVEGEVRSPMQVHQIIDMVTSDLESILAISKEDAENEPTHDKPGSNALAVPGNGGNPGNVPSPPAANPGSASSEWVSSKTKVEFPKPAIINLLRVPGVHQVLLKVRLAELNRTALREIGADWLGVDPATGSIFGTNIANGSTAAAGAAVGASGAGALAGSAANGVGSLLPKSTTAFGIFPSANFDIMIRALRQNTLLSILAEPNLMAMSGHNASFLAGGQFPVPVPQGGVGNLVTVEWKNFGVQLNFVPYVMEDESIRLAVTPTVSTIDFALGTTLVQGGSPVPGLNTRTATTTVELREGQTLAIAGLLQVTIDGNTARIPGLGDLPYIGPLFSNTSHKRTEKELLVLVTPYLVTPMSPDQVPPLPGADLKDPTDWEFYLKNKIEGQKDPTYRSTANWDTNLPCRRAIRLEKNCVSGPVGFSQ
jgi:pilus assembly protein CpaC